MRLFPTCEGFLVCRCSHNLLLTPFGHLIISSSFWTFKRSSHRSSEESTIFAKSDMSGAWCKRDLKKKICPWNVPVLIARSKSNLLASSKVRLGQVTYLRSWTFWGQFSGFTDSGLQLLEPHATTMTINVITVRAYILNSLLGLGSLSLRDEFLGLLLYLVWNGHSSIFRKCIKFVGSWMEKACF